MSAGPKGCPYNLQTEKKKMSKLEANTNGLIERIV